MTMRSPEVARSRGRSTKTALVSDFRRRQIVEAARVRFGRFGVARTTVDDIARAAGVAKGTVYLYYRSKDALLRQIVSEDLDRLQAETLPAITAPGDIPVRLRRFFDVTLAFFEQHREFFEQCHFGMTVPARRQVQQRLGVVFAAQVAAWRDVLGAARRRRALGVADPDGAARAVVCLAHGLAVQYLRGWIHFPRDAAADSAAALVWQGLVSR